MRRESLATNSMYIDVLLAREELERDVELAERGGGNARVGGWGAQRTVQSALLGVRAF